MEFCETALRWNGALPKDKGLILKMAATIQVAEDSASPEGYLAASLPSTQSLALFSSLAYKKKVDLETNLPAPWQLIGSARCDWWKLTNGYRGRAFWNPKTRQVVIANRGTRLSNVGSLWTDLTGICWNNITRQMLSAMTFTEEVLKCTAGICDTVILTGHSLGGWLSMTTAFSAQYLSINSGSFQRCKTIKTLRPRCVVFDSPGARTMLRKLQDSCEPSVIPNTSLDELDIVNYISSPNLINGIKHHVGEILQIVSAPTKHSLKTIKAAFDNETEEFGELVQVVDYPTSVAGVLFLPRESNDPRYTNQSGYKIVPYITVPYEGARCAWSAFSSLARKFLKTYKILMTPFVSDVLPKLEGIFELLNDYIVKENHIAFPSYEILRFFIPNIEKLVHQHPIYVFEMLSQWNIRQIQCKMALNFSTNLLSSVNLLPLSQRLVYFVTNDDVNLTVLRILHSLGTVNFLLLTQNDLLYTKLYENNFLLKIKGNIVISLDPSTPPEYYLDTIDQIQKAHISSFLISPTDPRIEMCLTGKGIFSVLIKPCTWQDFHQDSQNQLLQQQIIAFQGYDDCLSTFSDVLTSVTDFSNIATPQIINKLIGGEKVYIGQPVSSSYLVPVDYNFTDQQLFFDADSIYAKTQKKDSVIIDDISEEDFLLFFNKSPVFSMAYSKDMMKTSRNIIHFRYENGCFRMTQFKGIYGALLRYVGQDDLVLRPTLTLKNCIADFDKHYVHRRFTRTQYRINMKKAVHIWTTKNDEIIVEGISEDKLRIQLKTDGATNDLRSYHAGGDVKFREMCSQNPNSNVYCLRFEENNFYLVGIRGNLKALRDALSSEENSDFPDILGVHEESVIEQSQLSQITLYSGEPGTGKSTLLSHMSLLAKRQYPSWYIKCLNLNDFTDVFNQHANNTDNMNALSFLINNMLKLSRTEAVVFRLCVKQGSCLLFLDGFDEVSPYYKSFTLALVDKLRYKSKMKCVISTRTHLQVCLEDSFNVLCYTLGPFTESEKNEYLRKHCTSLEMVEAVKNCLGSFTSVIWHDFVNIPLILWMLVDEATATLDMPVFSNPAELYERILSRKLNIIKDKEVKDSGGVVATRNFQLYKTDTWIIHVRMAQELLCPEDKFFREVMPSYRDDPEVDILKLGIVVDREGKFVFIHFTIPEYLVAHAIYQCLNQRTISLEMHNLILHSILRKEQYKNVRRFLDNMLTSKMLLNVPAINWASFDYSFRQKGTSFLHFATWENNLSIMKYFLNYCRKQEHLDVNEELLCVTDKCETAAYIAANLRRFDALLLLSQDSPDAFYTPNADRDTAVHAAVGIYDEENRNRAKITQWLDHVIDKINWTLGNGQFETPVVSAARSGKYYLIDYFLSRERFDVLYHSDKYGATVLHYLISFYVNSNLDTEDKMSWLLKTVAEPTDVFKKLLRRTDKCGRTGFHYCGMKAQYNIFDFLSKNWEDCSYLYDKDKDGRTPVHFLCLTSGGNPLQTEARDDWFKRMTGIFDWSVTDRYGNTPVHSIGQSANFALLELLHAHTTTSRFNEIVGFPNHEGQTALHYFVDPRVSFDVYTGIRSLHASVQYQTDCNAGPNTPFYTSLIQDLYFKRNFISRKDEVRDLLHFRYPDIPAWNTSDNKGETPINSLEKIDNFSNGKFVVTSSRGQHPTSSTDLP